MLAFVNEQFDESPYLFGHVNRICINPIFVWVQPPLPLAVDHVIQIIQYPNGVCIYIPAPVQLECAADIGCSPLWFLRSSLMASPPLPLEDESLSLLANKRTTKNGFCRKANILSVFNKLTTTITYGDSTTVDKDTVRVVRYIFAMALLVNMMHASNSPAKLLYLQSVGFASSNDINSFVWTEIIVQIVPIFGHLFAGYLATRTNPGFSICFLSVCHILGTLLVVQTSSLKWKPSYFFGFLVLSLSRSIRVVRFIVITETVPLSERTSVMAIHDFWGPCGAILGPIFWILIQNFQADIPVLGTFGFRLNRYTANYLFSSCIAMVIGTIAWKSLNYRTIRQHDNLGSSRGTTSVGPSFVNVQLGDGSELVVNTARYALRTTLYFLILTFAVDVTMGLIFVGFQPILINNFQIDGRQLGYAYEIIGLLAVIPPIILAYISHFLKDRQIMLIALIIKFVGVLLFMPIFGRHMYSWQPILGFLLIIKASMFFWTTSESLTSKLLGPMSSGTLLGLVSSASEIGPAIAQIAFSKGTVSVFGTYKYGLIAIPLIVAILMVVTKWEKLDHDREFTRALFREYDDQYSNSTSK